MSILKNAIDSIAIGLEDYQSPDNRRIVSSTRNIFAGILLLFKHKLCELSPASSDEVLIKQKIVPAFDAFGSIMWVGDGKKTVDVHSIQERFESLGILVDWKRLREMNAYRNDIEHYYSTLKSSSVQKLISDSFLIIRDFIVEHLQADPRELLGAQAWNILMDVNEVYEREKLGCDRGIESLDYFSESIKEAFQKYSCNQCGSDLLCPSEFDVHSTEVEYTCKSCGLVLQYEEFVQEALSEYFSYELYQSHKHGGDSPLAGCSECGGPYLYLEGVCAACGHSADHECQLCRCRIVPEEMSTAPYCGYCSHVLSKDD